ncbi:hypothetical protein AMTRI_Chr02g214040 [Amborella trichopoda]
MLKLALLLLLLLCFSFSCSNAKNQPFAIRISCGARQNVYTSPTNALWLKDFGYTGGKPANSSPSAITPPLHTLRYFPLSDGPENCYTINNIPNGHYSVRIFFGLLSEPNFENEPLFDVSVEGTLVYSLKSGWTTVDEQSFAEAILFISDKSVSTCFHSTGHGDPTILSIEILQIDENAYNFGQEWDKRTILRTSKRLSCGAGKPAFDEDYIGDQWGGDRFWKNIAVFDSISNIRISTEEAIAKASVAPNFYPKKLYQSAIVSTDNEPDLSYSTEVDPNKNYSIWLHFAEIDYRDAGEGKRVFDILINGDVAFRDVDVYKISGGLYAALVLNKTVAVNGRTLTITLHPTKGNSAIVNAIEIFEVIAMEFKSSVIEVRALQTLKGALGLPLRFGWNGDPCVPQQHPWSGVDCQFDERSSSWVIDGLGLDNQGLKGFLPDDIANLKHLQNINLSGNSIHGSIPYSIGAITELESLDLSYNMLNGSIPESLGQLTMLHTLDLNGNLLSGRVPAALGGRPLHRASFNFTGNAGLCGIPGLPSCGPHLSAGSKAGIAFGIILIFLLIVVFSICMWKRRQNILRAQKLAARDAPYAKARTHFVRDVQMTRTYGSDQARVATESGPRLLS